MNGEAPRPSSTGAAGATDVLEGIARVAAGAFGAPVALLRLAGQGRGVAADGIALDAFLGEHTAGFFAPLEVPGAVTVVRDVRADGRFARDPRVAGEPGVRFLASAPVLAPSGDAIGCLCVLDVVPREPPAGERFRILEDLAAAAATAHLGLQATRELESTRQRYGQLVDLAVDSILAIDPGGVVTYANAHAVASFGHPREVLQGMRASDLVHPDELADHHAAFEEIRRGEVVSTERRMVRQDGSTFVAEIRTRLTPDGGFQAILRDVTEGRRALERVQTYGRFRQGLVRLVNDLMSSGDEAEIFRTVLRSAVETIPGAQAGSILEHDADAPDVYRFAAALGYDLAALQQAVLFERELEWDPRSTDPSVLHGFRSHLVSDPERVEILRNVGSTGDIRSTLIVPARHRDRTVAWLLVDSFEDADAFGDDAREMGMLLAQQLAALLHRAELDRGLQAAALTDALTGLPNRTRLTRTLDDRLARRERPTVLFLDLDDFKVVNDGFGHGAGDDLLRQVAGRLTRCLRAEDVAARWAGDEFVILLGRDAEEAGAREVSQRLFRALSRPFRVRDRDVFVRASIGIATASAGADAGELIEWADVALTQAKRRGKNCFEVFEPAMRQRLVLRRDLEEDLRYALQHDEFTLHYQPRVDLLDDRIRSVEALARWPHPKRGMIGPGTFIPLAEETGMIHELGRQMLDLACRQAKLWSEVGTPVRVAVNISARQLVQPDFVGMITCTLEQHRLDPSLLELEITESVAASEGTAVAGKLDALHALGIHIAIDDFGTAYSSLSRLRTLPIQTLKIDQSFVRDLDGEEPEKATSVVRAIVTLARSLNLHVIAEGIETEAQRAVLRALDVDEAQGYLFARPAPPAEVSERLHRDGARLVPAEPVLA